MSTTQTTPQTMDELTPEEAPRAGATKDSTLFYIGVSFLLHLALLLGTSYHFIYDSYIDPVGAKQRAAAKAALAEAAATQAAADAAAANPPAPGSAEKPKSASASGAPAKPGDTATSNPADESPMAKSLHEATPAKDIPKNADGLGLDLSDTAIKK